MSLRKVVQNAAKQAPKLDRTSVIHLYRYVPTTPQSVKIFLATLLMIVYAAGFKLCGSYIFLLFDY